jgi:hypothetical protein
MGHGTTTFDDLLSVAEAAAPHLRQATITETEQWPLQQARLRQWSGAWQQQAPPAHARFNFDAQESRGATIWGTLVMVLPEIVQSPGAQRYVATSPRPSVMTGPEQELEIIVKMLPRQSRATLVKIVGRVKARPNPMF